MLKILRNLNYSKKVITEKNIENAEYDIFLLMKHIKERKQENPDLKTEEILESIKKSYRDIAFENRAKKLKEGKVVEVPIFTRSDFFLLKTISKLKKNPSEIWEIIDKSDRNELVKNEASYKYTPNMQTNKRNLIQNACSIYTDKISTPNYKQRFIDGTLTVKEREFLQKKMIEAFTYLQTRTAENNRIAYAYHITEIAKVLEENGILNLGIDINNKKLEKLGLEDLKEEETKGNKGIIRNMSDWCNLSVVSKLPLDELVTASAYFTNRICKELLSFQKAEFLIRELNLMDKEYPNYIIQNKQLKAALSKYNFLKYSFRDIFAKKEIIIPEKKGEAVKKANLNISYTDEEKEEYKKFYEEDLPNSQNDIIEDTLETCDLSSIMEDFYAKKEFAIDALVVTLLDSKDKWNWGYIPEVDKGRNSIVAQKRMIELGFDVRGFNTTIRLHDRLDRLKKTLKEYFNSTEMPVFKGLEDFTIEDEKGNKIEWTTQVYRQTTKNERKKIRELLASMDPKDRRYDFVAHINWIANGVKPEKYKKDMVVSLDSGRIMEDEDRI